MLIIWVAALLSVALASPAVEGGVKGKVPVTGIKPVVIPAVPYPVEKIPVFPVDEHHVIVEDYTTVIKAALPVVPTVGIKVTKEKIFVEKAKSFIAALYRLQTFERTFMANPFPVDEHFRLVFDSMVKLGVERSQLENLRRKVFTNLEFAQKASFEHSYEITTMINLVKSVIYAVDNNVTDAKTFFTKRKVAIEEVCSILKDELTDIRLNIGLGLNSYTETIKALTDVYTTPESYVVKRHMKFVVFVYDLGHEELNGIVSSVHDEYEQFLEDYEKFVNDIVAAVEDFITPDDTTTLKP